MPRAARYAFVVSSTGMRPTFAPISTAIFVMAMRSSMDRARIVSPAYSTALYVAPAWPIIPMVLSEMSLVITPADSAPCHKTRMVSGTFSQVCPVTSTPSISVEPMPVANAPSAPPIQVCESVPSTTLPGRTLPVSAMT